MKDKKGITITNAFQKILDESNRKSNKIWVDNHVRISKYKNISAKGYVIIKVKNTVLWTHVISDLNGQEIFGMFYKRELQKTNPKEFRAEKVIKRKGDKLYVKCKCYNDSFNSWIDKRDIV